LSLFAVVKLPHFVLERLCSDAGKRPAMPHAQNGVMVGAFAGFQRVPLRRQVYLRPIEKIIAGTKLQNNRKAFELGYLA
jgi:Pyruvate/2-oxoacid:ferredoxin oxidoreductase gamma subunit